jgi:hypothetical protein
MNLAEKFNKKSEEIENRVDEITNEIVLYFKNIFETGEFENVLERNLTKEDKIKRRKILFVEFWNYSSGCSDTNFRVGFHTWKNPEGNGFKSRRYKGLELYDIQKDVGKKLLNLTEYYLKDMGFKITIENDESWLNNYKKKITISW